VARFDPAKDYTTFLRAALRLLDSNQHVSFVLVGRGVVPSNPHLQEILGSNEARHRTHMLGVRMDVPKLLAALDIFTCSSASEGFANVIGEAMACGVPCVVTDVGDSARIVGDTGRVVAPRDPGALAAAWESLLQAGPQARQQLGARARQRVEQHYSLEAVTRMYEELYLSWSEE
jgi:glycosyltransferase involved in cell wall biosynthesis